jgi:MoaA/NifB/PqqE/SkfB family radical SAM enzyme
MIYPALSQVTKNIRSIIQGEPCIFLPEILLTYHCTQRCLQCNIPAKTTSVYNMTTDTFKIIVSRLKAHGAHGVVFSGGEPLLNIHFTDFIRYAQEINIHYLHVLTTLYLPHKKMEHLAWALISNRVHISTSFDGFNEVADKIRGAKDVSDTVLENMKTINRLNRDAAKKVKTYVNVVISQMNLHQIPEILACMQELGWMINVDLYRHTSSNHNYVDEMVIRDYDRLQEVLEIVKKSPMVFTPRWLLDGFNAYLESRFTKRCPYTDNTRLGSKISILPDGEVKVCIGQPVGNLLNSDLRQIFDSPAWRDKQQEFRACPGCWNTCYTPSSRLSSYFNTTDLKKIIKLVT